ncbi:LytTR family DNA-binding domain-containing protein [Phenylobacterium sp.]|uniref:LytTR family DNA-binding domain-containing protein n=1 Tax=Phenylobacterium sp. TaxID=1871053 RepID=UPI003561B199
MASPQKRLSWGPYDTWVDWARGFGLAVVAAGFLAYGGAFGSGVLTTPVRFAYWFGLMIVGWVWGVFVSSYVFRPHRRVRQHLWRRVLLTSLAISIPYSVVVGVVTHFTRGSRFDNLIDLTDLLVSVTLISAVMIGINVLVGRQMGAMTSASSEPPKFLDRLPLKLRGAEIWAVEAEDHYLRLHTSKGQDLILMRLSDAIAELEGIEGAQVHRSWWVSRDAIAGAVRGDGRATLTLTDGAEAPVSRTYARLLRERGWI